MPRSYDLNDMMKLRLNPQGGIGNRLGVAAIAGLQGGGFLPSSGAVMESEYEAAKRRYALQELEAEINKIKANAGLYEAQTGKTEAETLTENLMRQPLVNTENARTGAITKQGNEYQSAADLNKAKRLREIIGTGLDIPIGLAEAFTKRKQGEMYGDIGEEHRANKRETYARLPGRMYEDWMGGLSKAGSAAASFAQARTTAPKMNPVDELMFKSVTDQVVKTRRDWEMWDNEAKKIKDVKPGWFSTGSGKNVGIVPPGESKEQSYDPDEVRRMAEQKREIYEQTLMQAAPYVDRYKALSFPSPTETELQNTAGQQQPAQAGKSKPSPEFVAKAKKRGLSNKQIQSLWEKYEGRQAGAR